MIVDLKRLWLNAVDDLATGVAFEVHEIEHNPTVNVRTDPYAGGNFRAVVVAGKQRNARVTLGFCTDVQAGWLKDHQGVLICYRDPRGEKFYGIYAEAGFAPRRMPDSWQITLSVAQVTVNEGIG